MVTFFETILVFAGIGQLLDLILIGSNERTKLAAFIERARPRGTFLSKYLAILSLSRDIVFGRFFSESFASWRFFRSAALLSIVSFTLIVFVQTALYGGLPTSLASLPQILTITAFLVFNIAIDYLSISQTKAFIDASANAKSWFRSLLFLISDVLVTMNIFILAFSAFLMIFAYIYLIPSATSQKTVIFIRDSAGVALRKEVRNDGRTSTYTTSSTAILLEPMVGGVRGDFLSYEGTIDLGPDTFQKIVREVVGDSLTAFSILPADLADALKKLDIAVSDDTLQRALSEMYLKDGTPEAFIISVSSTFSPKSLGEISIAYSSVFGFVDLLEDSFPQNIMSEVGWDKLSNVISGIYRNQVLRGPQYQIFCFDNGLLLRSYFSDKEPIEFGNDCKKNVMLSSSDRRLLISDLALAGRGTESIYIPYLPMFITSIFPTFFFYFTILALSLSTYVFQLFVSQLKVRKELMLRVPITLPMAIIGLVYAL